MPGRVLDKELHELRTNGLILARIVVDAYLACKDLSSEFDSAPGSLGTMTDFLEFVGITLSDEDMAEAGEDLDRGTE